MIIIIVVLISFFMILLAAAIFIITRLRKRRRQRRSRADSLSSDRPHPTHSSTDIFSTDPDPFASTTHLAKSRPFSGYGTSITDPSHPAARITPFGSPGGETPQYSTSLLPPPLFSLPL